MINDAAQAAIEPEKLPGTVGTTRIPFVIVPGNKLALSRLPPKMRDNLARQAVRLGA